MISRLDAYAVNIFIIVFLLIFNIDSVAADAPPAARACEGPTDLVEVFVKVSEYGAIYRYTYTIINKHKYPIFGFKLGDSYIMEMNPLIKQNITVSESPEGWPGRVGQRHESVYQSIYWSGRASKKFIEPGQSLTGFVVTASASPDPQKGWIGNNGLPLTATDVKRLPFQASFSGRSCVWGRPMIEK